jgi:hypothetical protein
MLDNLLAQMFFRLTFLLICGTDVLLSYNGGWMRPLIEFGILWNRNIMITSSRMERMTMDGMAGMARMDVMARTEGTIWMEDI